MEQHEIIGLTVGLVILLFATVSGAIIGEVDYQYEVDKCKEMNSGESAFDFDNDIQVNAMYDSHCRYVNKHPLAQFGNVFGCAVVGFLLGILPGFLLGILFYWLSDKY